MTLTINRAMGPGEWMALVGLSVLWGGSFLFVGIVVDALPPLTIVVLRVGLAALALHAVVLVMGRRMPTDRRIWGAFFVMGCINNVVPFSLIVWGQAHIASGLASILNATTPMFTVLVAHVLTDDEKLTASRAAGVAIGLAGAVLVIGPGTLYGLGTDFVAQLAILGAAVSYAFAGVYGRRFRRIGVPSLVTATGQVTASTAMLVPFALFVERPWEIGMPGVEIVGAVLGLALLSTALAYILYFRLLASAGATNLLLVTFLIPVSAVLLGAAVLGERLDPQDFLGMGVIGLGLAAIDGRLVGVLRRVARLRRAPRGRAE